tara:strand:- start:360 stop:587 length:228 start_codon:yes stop_codon:yes gene_type:complete
MQDAAIYALIFLVGCFLGFSGSKKHTKLLEESKKRKKEIEKIKIKKALIERALRRRATRQALKKQRDGNTHDKQS